MNATSKLKPRKTPRPHTYPKTDVILSTDEKELREMHLKHAVELGKDARQVTLLVATVNQILRLHTRILHVTNKSVLLSGDVIVPIGAVHSVIFV